MTIDNLKASVSKAELKVEKCKSTIERHEKQLQKKIKAGDTYEIKWKKEDIVNANKKLVEAERVLNNWKNKLDIELEKERFIEGNAPEVIKVFLEDWKTKALKWHLTRYANYQKFKKDLSEENRLCRVDCIKTTPEYSKYLKYIEDPNSDLLNVFPRSFMDNHLKKNGMDYKSINQKKTAFAGVNVMYMDSIYNKNERFNWIEGKLEKEKKLKMIDLITRINNEVGEIIDAENLEISAKGNLDGIVVGFKGDVKITTIEAGGFNIQCFHYRTLIKKIK